MTDPRSPSDDDLVLAAFDGNANSDARAPLSPSVQAEIDGLRAVRALLNDDAAWGEHSGVDAPPSHLLDAILRAEVAARSDVVRQAITTASSPATAPSSAWQRLSSWLVGGGVLVGAAAAVLLTVSREPTMQADSMAAPKMAEAPAAIADGVLRSAAPGSAIAEVAAAPPPPPPPPAPVAAAAAEGAPEPLRAQDTLGFADAAKDESRVAGPAGGGFGLTAPGATKGALGDIGGSVADDKPASPVSAVSAVAPAKAAPPAARKADASFASEAEADDDVGQRALRPAPAPAAEAPPPPAAPAPAAALSGNEVRRVFRERMSEKKAEAIEDAREEAKEGKAKKAPSADSLVRDRQVQEANSTLLTAERELSQGRFGTALDLALRAEATSAGALGLAPVSTQARALRGLGRPADAARLGNRLLSANPADRQLMAGVIAAAASAFDIGDRQLCRRLSQLALQKPNVDEKLRAEAKRLLALVAQPAATKPADAATDAPAKP
jgi:hypothetical protein